MGYLAMKTLRNWLGQNRPRPSHLEVIEKMSWLQIRLLVSTLQMFLQYDQSQVLWLEKAH